ncbi:hypothetical protein MMC14_007469 [Varicellaria rhodocarpa]|nr:hypothetical protein [Varicellaria rhodocarpa]
MFCTSLRKRTDIKDLVARLTSSKEGALQGMSYIFHLLRIETSSSSLFPETNLYTHDLAFPLPPSPPISTSTRTLRVLLLSVASLHETAKLYTISRIERFSSLTGGDCIAMAILLHTSSDDAQQPPPDAMHAYTSLQVLIHTHSSLSVLSSIPLLPIPTSSHLLPLLHTHLALLSSPLPPPPSTSSSPHFSLLPHLTATAPARPLSEHATYVLSDLCQSIKDIAVLAGKEDDVLESYLGREEGKGIREFWGEEWVFE